MDKSEPCTIKNLIFDSNQNPDHNAIECPGQHPLTYRDLRSQVTNVVKTLNTAGFHRNTRIAVVTPAGPETAVIIISLMAGFTVVPMNPQNREQEYNRYFSQMKINALVIQKGYETSAAGVAESQDIPVIELLPVFGFAGKFGLKVQAAPDAGEAEFATPSDIAVLLSTSGTTGNQKTVPVTQKQFFLARQRHITVLKITNSDRFLNILPYYHAMGLGTPLSGTLLAGGTVICTKDFIPSDFLPLLRTYHPTWYSAGPAIHQAILREIKKTSSEEELKDNSLRGILSGSAHLPAAIHQGLKGLLGVPVSEIFASSETGLISINLPAREGSVGIPVIEHLKILDEDGTVLGNGCEGEIVVKGETVFSGYEDAPDGNKAAFTDGWFRTGDLGYLDDDGYLFLTGRKKELINKGGEKISPEEIDTVLKSHPRVRDAMTFGIADTILGEDVAALIVPADDSLTGADLRRFLLDRLAPFKLPRKIWFVDEIPRTATGKPLRRAGTERYCQAKPDHNP
jgi:acyl-CoA synthetase (AMP-forming)/AMP-acid ligase II